MCVTGFFFFKQKTAYEMRISDWSSDVCSSDLAQDQGQPHEQDAAWRRDSWCNRDQAGPVGHADCTQIADHPVGGRDARGERDEKKATFPVATAIKITHG